MKRYKLGEIAYFVEEKISSDELTLNEYITTDCLLQNKKGRTIATNLPPKSCSLTKFKKGDVLIGNIRPYLKKIWFAESAGGCSLDVLVLRAKKMEEASFLYSLLLQDDFFDFVMKAPKGSKMPRGDKNHILTYPCFDIQNKIEVGSFIKSLDDKIALNKKINAKLEAMAKRLYDYWFVQFDYSDKNGKPYKTSGGKMVWNEVLKREIPVGWEVKSVFEASDVLYGYPYATEPFDEDNLELSKKPYKVVRIRDIQNNSFSAKTTEVVDEKYKTKQNDLLVGMDGYFHMNFWFSNNDYINQRIVRFRKTLISTLILNFQIKPFIKFKETMAKGSTVGHLSDKDLKQLFIAIPNDNSISDRFDSILNMITKNNSEIQKLTELRDRLLPLLMNGQVEVGTNNSSEFCNAKLGKQATACDMNGQVEVEE